MSSFPVMCNSMHAKKIRQAIEQEQNGPKPSGTSVGICSMTETLRTVDISQHVQPVTRLMQVGATGLLGSVQGIFSKN